MKPLQNHDIEMDWRYYNDGNTWLGKALLKKILNMTYCCQLLLLHFKKTKGDA